MRTKPNDLAFCPSDKAIENNKNYHYEEDYKTASPLGLTKREHFASLALQGILANSTDRGETAAANMAVKFADELINALNR